MGNSTRSQIGRAALAALAVAAFLAAGPAQAQITDSVAVTNQVVALMNQERAKQNLPPLTRQCDLDAAAARHVNDMTTWNILGDQGSDGTDVVARVRQAGYTGSLPIAQMITAGPSSAERVLANWMAGAHYRELLRRSDLKEAGIAVAYRAGTQFGYYWVAVLAGGGGRACAPTEGTPAQLPQLQAQSVTLEGKIQSVEAARGTSIRFVNFASFPVQIYWLDYQGKRVPYATLAAQQTYIQSSYVSHPWLVARASDSAPLAIFEATLQPSMAQITGTTATTRALPLQLPGFASDVRSRTLGGASTIEFRNNGPSPVQIIWIDFEGKRVPYNTLQTGQAYTQETFLGHIWQLADPNGTAVGIVEPTTSGGIATFKFWFRD